MIDHTNIADSTEKLKRGLVGCKKCGVIIRVDSAEALQQGWPKCHGETMTLDIEEVPTPKLRIISFDDPEHRSSS